MRRGGLPLLVLYLLLTACGGEMEDQEKYEPYEESALFPDGMVNQRPVPGTIYRGQLDQLAALETRPEMTRALLDRGRERFDIFCSPCHGRSGYGEGIIVQRGFPQPPSFHSERLRQAPARHIVEVISDGYGVMYSYAARVPPADRWAIAAYVRALQLSQHADVAALPAGLRERVGNEPP